MDMDMLRYPAQSVDALIRGLITDNAEKVDITFVDDVSWYASLFESSH